MYFAENKEKESNELTLPPPNELISLFPLSSIFYKKIESHRAEIKNILTGIDPKRRLLIIGPCSIHDSISILDYALRLSNLQTQFSDRIKFVIRVYYEKPRTSHGWTGYIYDPDINGSYNIYKGIYETRQLLTKIVQLDLAIACEVVDPIFFSYFFDLISWVAIGARTVRSPPHRQFSSSLDIAVGFKNPIDGDISAAINACKVANSPNLFLNHIEGTRRVVRISKGNPFAHIVLRGHKNGVNFHKQDVKQINKEMDKFDVNYPILIDCCHGNLIDDKPFEAFYTSISNMKNSNLNIKGLMLESHINDGKQAINITDNSNLRYGISITDKCIGWNKTKLLINAFYKII